MAPVLLFVMLGAVAVGALIIIGLVYWGRKQEHLGEMTHFCLKYLVHSEDEAERCAMAKALGGANDTAALLVLFDVALDEEEAGSVREAAREALHEMGENNRKHKDVVADFEVASEQRDLPSVIGVLITSFEHDGTGYAQSAYVIGRQYMYMGLYADAWEWLEKAELRNQKARLYGNQIRQLIRVCTMNLLEEADDSFKNGDYLQAKEQYAVLDGGLGGEDMRRCSMYLRSACTFIKLQDYRNADQSLLLALAKHHSTEQALILAPMLREILELGDAGPAPSTKRQTIEAAIDDRTTEIMQLLMARNC